MTITPQRLRPPGDALPQGFLPSVGAPSFLSSLYGKLMFQIGFDFPQDPLERRWRKVGVHVLQLLTAIKNPIEPFNTPGVMLLLGGIDPCHGGGKGLGFVNQIVETGDGPL